MNRRLNIICIIALSMVALWLLLGYLPASRHQARLRAQIAESKARLADYELTLGQLPVFIQTRQSMVERLANVDSRLYAKDDLARLFDEIRITALNHGVRLTDITPPVEELLKLNRSLGLANEPQFLNLTLWVQGPFIPFGQFVATLEQAPYFRAIENCTIAPAQDGSGRTTYVLAFKALLGRAKETA